MSNCKSALLPETLHAIWRNSAANGNTLETQLLNKDFRLNLSYVQQLLLNVNSDQWDSYLDSLEFDHASVL